MGYGPFAIFSDTIASGASTSAGINLTRSWNNIHVVVPTMSTAADIGVQATPDSGTTWYNVHFPSINSATVGTPRVYLSSVVGTGGGVAPLPVGGLPYIRFQATAVVSGGVIFKIICAD